MSKIKREKGLKNLLSNYGPATRYAESYRTLRTNLHFAVPEKALTSLVVTSSVPEEGKTNTAVNLGHTIAQSDKKVLIADMDLRKPMLTSLYGLGKNKGMVDLLSDLLETSIDSGQLSDYGIWDLHQFIRYQKRTGTLNITADSDSVSLFFINGTLSDLLWHNRPEEKKLINVLIQKKMINPEDAQLVMATMKKTGRKLSSVFHSMGLISDTDLRKELSKQAAEVIRVISTINQGRFEFTAGHESDIKSAFSTPLDLEAIFNDFFDEDESKSRISQAIDALIHPTDVENLFVLPSGKPPSHPAELIASERTDFIIQCLKKKFDFVIFDTPPVVPATDSQLVAPRTDGTLLVVRSAHSNKKVVKEVVSRFTNSNLRILGIVLNRVDMKKEGYYYRYYQKYYASYYGEK